MGTHIETIFFFAEKIVSKLFWTIITHVNKKRSLPRDDSITIKGFLPGAFIIVCVPNRIESSHEKRPRSKPSLGFVPDVLQSSIWGRCSRSLRRWTRWSWTNVDFQKRGLLFSGLWGYFFRLTIYFKIKSTLWSWKKNIFWGPQTPQKILLFHDWYIFYVVKFCLEFTTKQHIPNQNRFEIWIHVYWFLMYCYVITLGHHSTKFYYMNIILMKY